MEEKHTTLSAEFRQLLDERSRAAREMNTRFETMQSNVQDLDQRLTVRVASLEKAPALGGGWSPTAAAKGGGAAAGVDRAEVEELHEEVRILRALFAKMGDDSEQKAGPSQACVRADVDRLQGELRIITEGFLPLALRLDSLEGEVQRAAHAGAIQPVDIEGLRVEIERWRSHVSATHSTTTPLTASLPSSPKAASPAVPGTRVSLAPSHGSGPQSGQVEDADLPHNLSRSIGNILHKVSMLATQSPTSVSIPLSMAAPPGSSRRRTPSRGASPTRLTATWLGPLPGTCRTPTVGTPAPTPALPREVAAPTVHMQVQQPQQCRSRGLSPQRATNSWTPSPAVVQRVPSPVRSTSAMTALQSPAGSFVPAAGGSVALCSPGALQFFAAPKVAVAPLGSVQIQTMHSCGMLIAARGGGAAQLSFSPTLLGQGHAQCGLNKIRGL
mmetsp:Transcript_28096/g.71107  ORF Transcript_28096/g.71107 Transcript_28096/m.71107 type:complete len:442 (-) Transcript_28096:45-1370(-)